jgi:hypothetical protein
VDGGILFVGVEDDLRDAITVAEVDEDHTAKVAAAVNPPHQK